MQGGAAWMRLPWFETAGCARLLTMRFILDKVLALRSRAQRGVSKGGDHRVATRMASRGTST
jgi:hypothetical protein